MSGIEYIKKLRDESFNKETERLLESHPYLRVAENGTLSLSQRRAFVKEQYAIQRSDAISFASLAGHRGFRPETLTGIAVPELVSTTTSSASPSSSDGEPVDDLFHFLLGGEIYAASLLLAHAKSVGLDETALGSSASYHSSCKAQAYPSYWARLALSNQRAAAAAACAVNFPAWGAMCARLLRALGSEPDTYNYEAGVEDEGLAFIKFFATPIEGLDEMAAAIIDQEEGVEYEDLVESVRLLQEYEIMFWDAVFEAK